MNYAEDKSTFYSNNMHIASLYKQDFETAEEWENEKEIIRQKIRDENAFIDELKVKHRAYETTRTDIQKKIKDTVDEIEKHLTPEQRRLNAEVNAITLAM